MLSRLQDFAVAHLVLWPALAVIVMLYLVAFWVRFHRRDNHNTVLMLVLTASYLIGLAIVVVALFKDDELPRWFRKASVMTALGVFSILSAWLSFFVANKWVLHVTSDADRKRSEAVKPK